MNAKLQFNFSHEFKGVVWNIIALPGNNVLLVEVRDHEKKSVSFSALNYRTNSFLWRDKKLEEPWWINLTSASEGVLLFTLYTEGNNPDQKGILAYDLNSLDLLWWRNNFSVIEVHENIVHGVSSKFELKDEWIDLHTGEAVVAKHTDAEAQRGEQILRPFQYAEETAHFNTIKKFLSEKLNLSPVASLEYLESNSLIFLSYYEQKDGLANYLLVLSETGDVLLEEKLGECLKGIGLDTFFIFDGCLIFVKNKTELVSYKISTTRQAPTHN